MSELTRQFPRWSAMEKAMPINRICICVCAFVHSNHLIKYTYEHVNVYLNVLYVTECMCVGGASMFI